MSFQKILNEIAAYPLLSHEDTLRICRDLKRHERDAWKASGRRREEDFTGEKIRALGKESAKVRAHLFHANRCVDLMTRGNLRLVAKYTIAYSKRVQHLDLEDLFQEGSIGLLCAIRRFKPELGYKFSTYATWWIQHHLGRAVANQERAVRVPVHLTEMSKKVNHARHQLLGILGRGPTTEELAQQIGMSVKKLQRITDAMTPTLSLDQSYDESGVTLYNLLTDPDAESMVDVLARSEIALQLVELLDELPPVQRSILIQRFGFGAQEKTLAEIGQERDLSRERIRQLEVVALKNLRRLFNRGAGPKCETIECVEPPAAAEIKNEKPPKPPEIDKTERPTNHSDGSFMWRGRRRLSAPKPKLLN
jgi:RNA polymerase sigma factor (sigma-70 family)